MRGGSYSNHCSPLRHACINDFPEIAAILLLFCPTDAEFYEEYILKKVRRGQEPKSARSK